MENHLHRVFMLFFLGGLATAIWGQNSPPVVLTDYDNTSLPLSYQINSDTTFCKGRSMTLHGQYFKKVTSGELWDTTQVFLGGQRIWPQSISSTMGGTEDRIVLQVPATFLADTCLRIEVVKRTILALDTFLYRVSDTICLTGDRAAVSYGAPQYCVGDANPLPSVVLSPPTAVGGFCCRAGAPGFWVNPVTGEIPLHQGAVGPSNQFLFVTNHPRCADTVALSVGVVARQPAVATIQGQSAVVVCQGAGIVHTDTALQVPQSAVFRSPTGLYLVNPLSGSFDPDLSPVGLHTLWLVPVGAGLCYDSVAIQVVVLPRDTTVIAYPSVSVQMGLRRLCQNAGIAWPSFGTGSAGGQFWSRPAGLDVGSQGEIRPQSSLVGSYSLRYLAPGPCADTVVVFSQLQIDTALNAQFSLGTAQYCAGVPLQVQAGFAGGSWTLRDAGGQVVGNWNGLPISLPPQIGAGIYTLAHVVGTQCRDTAVQSLTVIAQDDPSFSYPPTGSFCLGDADPWPLIAGNGGGTFWALSPGTVVDVDGRLRLQASGAGLHQIGYRTAGFCKDSLVQGVQVYGSASASFGYASSVFCTGDTHPLPVILGTPGGVFTGDLGLVVDAASGGIDLALSLPGVWNVTYTLTGSCQAQFTQTVQVMATDSATTMHYLDRHYCLTGLDPMPVVLGDTVGSFVAGGGIVFSNTDRGQLDLSAMAVGGPYLVYYDVENRCARDVQDSVWIDATDDPSFQYPQAAYCVGAANPVPDFVALPGGLFSEPTGSVVFVSVQTGELDADLSLAGGPYFIQYQTAGACAAAASFQLTLLRKPEGFGLAVSPDTVYCAGASLSLQVQAGGAMAYRWALNGDLLPAQGSNLVLDAAQLHAQDTVVLVLENAVGCKDSLAQALAQVPAPQLRLLDRQVRYQALGGIALDYRLGADQAQTEIYWQLAAQGLELPLPSSGVLLGAGPGQPVDLQLQTALVRAEDLGVLVVDLSSAAGGCAGPPLVLRDTLSQAELAVFVPEVISPDGNGHNDTWLLTCLGDHQAQDFNMLLYNGAGGQVLAMDGLRQDFDGGNLPDGVYWWLLVARSTGEVVQSGGLTIRRK